MLSMVSERIPEPLQYLFPCPGTNGQEFLRACISHTLIFRTGLAFILLHTLIIATITLCKTQLLNKYCILGKFLLLAGLFIGSFFIEPTLFRYLYGVCFVLNIPYLILTVGVQFMDLMFKVGKRVSLAHFEAGQRWAKYVLIAVSLTCSVVTGVTIWRVYQAGFSAISLVLIVCTIVSYLLSGLLAKFNPSANLMTTSMFCAVCATIVHFGVNSSEQKLGDEDQNGRLTKTQQYMFYSAFIVLLLLNLGFKDSESDSEGESSSSIKEGKTYDRASVTTLDSSRNFDIIDRGSSSAEGKDEHLGDFVTFHLCMIGSTTFICMLISGWNYQEKNETYSSVTDIRSNKGFYA